MFLLAYPFPDVPVPSVEALPDLFVEPTLHQNVGMGLCMLGNAQTHLCATIQGDIVPLARPGSTGPCSRALYAAATRAGKPL